MSPVIHTLKNGATLISLHPHGFEFSDGTSCPEQCPDLVKTFKLEHDVKFIGQKAGMNIVRRRPVATHTQLEVLAELVTKVDLVICPTELIGALYHQGWRDHFDTCVSIGPTKETRGRREIPLIVDVNGWRY